jgi:hypothetical protein
VWNNSPFLFRVLRAEEEASMESILKLLLSTAYVGSGFLTGLGWIGTFLAGRNPGI